VLTLTVGLSLSAPVWVPVLEQLKYSNRLIVPTQIGYIYLPPWYLATMIFPNIFGAPYDARFLTLFQAIGVSHDHTLHMGIAALARLGVAVFWARRRRRGTPSPTEAHQSNPHQNASITGSDAAVTEQHRLWFSPSFGFDRFLFFALLSGFALLIIMAAPLY